MIEEVLQTEIVTRRVQVSNLAELCEDLANAGIAHLKLTRWSLISQALLWTLFIVHVILEAPK